MTINLSQFRGGGELFTPAMMLYNGSSHFWSEAVTTSGNKLVLFADFIPTDPLTGHGGIITCRGPTNYQRVTLRVVGSTNADNDRKGRMFVGCNDSSNVEVCKLFSDFLVEWGTRYRVYFEFDADTGAAQWIVNGVETDDLGNADRVAPTTATLDSGASSEITVGAAGTTAGSGSSLVANGTEIGLVAYDDSAGVTWQDYMQADGRFKESDWSGFLFANQHGEGSNNIGTGPDLTKAGTIVVGNGGNGPHPLLGLDTDGTAVAGDILTAKTAWVDGVEVIGSNATSDITGGKTLLFWDLMQLPNGALSGDEKPQFMVDGIVVSGITNLAKTASGVSNASASNGLLSISNLPTQTGRRRYVIAYDLDESGATNTILDFQFNRVDGSNYWLYRVIDQASDWVTLLYEFTAAVQTERDRNTWNQAIEHCTHLVVIEDYGDELQIVDTVAENGTGNVISGTWTMNYYVSSRPHKTGVDCYFQWLLQNGADRIRLQNVWIQDF
jgi:hypothetical protein